MAAVVAAHDPDAHARAYPRRPDAQLPFDPGKAPAGMPVMLDTSVYIHRLQRKLPAAVLEFVDSRPVRHSGIAVGELAVSAGILRPDDPRTGGVRASIMNLLAAIERADTVEPSAAAWAEAGMIAGILARTQHLARSRKELTPDEACCQEGKRRKLLSDALIFLNAVGASAMLISANLRDMDLLLRLKPAAHVLLYVPAIPA